MANNGDCRRRITLREIEIALVNDTNMRNYPSIGPRKLLAGVGPAGGRRYFPGCYFFSSAGLPAEAESLVTSANCFCASSISEGCVATLM